MKRSVLAVVATASVVVGATICGAPAFAVDVVPPHEVFASVRSMGLHPLSRPALRGEVYVLRAANRYGEPVRVVVEAHTGQVISVGPGVRVSNYYYEPTPRPPAVIPGPRHWPQRPAPRVAPADVFEDDDVTPLPPRNPQRVTGAARGYETAVGLPALTAAALPAKPPLPRPRPAATLAASSEPAVTGSIGRASAQPPPPPPARPDPAMPPMQGFE